jgi:hypothetical protein
MTFKALGPADMRLSRSVSGKSVAHFATVLIAMSALAGEARSAQRSTVIPDFSGLWARNSFAYETPTTGIGPVENASRLPSGVRDRNTLVGDVTNPILTPRAAEIVKQFGVISRSGVGFPDPNNQCWPEAPPYIFRVLETQILQLRDEIVILYSFDHQARHIRLNQPHPAQVTPSWYGDSIGHFEDGALVVDTVGFKVGPYTMIDRFGTPYSEAMHLVERFRLIDIATANAAMERNERDNGRIGADGGGGGVDPNDTGKALQILFTVEDKKFFTAPWSATVTYRRNIETWSERVCAENLRNYGVAEDPKVPIATKPDF